MTRKILIVDDSNIELVLLAGVLAREYTVVKASSGQIALASLAHDYQNISAILLDIMMPVMDGFEVLEIIKNNPLWRQIPVIVTTGISDENAQIKALELGANAYVTKPYNHLLLLRTLKNTLDLCENAALANSLRKDKLTSVYNREAFFIEAEKMIARQEPGYYYLSCLNIESFKVVNDQYGTEVGDMVLRHVAGCISDYVQPIGGICCRTMADSFGALYPASAANEALLSSHKTAMNPPCLDRGIKIRVGRYRVMDSSVPITFMLDRAVMAEKSVKGKCINYIAEYNERMRESLLHEQEITSTMHKALTSGQFEPWFQPQYNHATGALIGSEALVRWRHPQRGLVPPSDFIPVFERNGFIYEMDKYIWEQVCIHLRRWLDEEKSPLPVSVNISRYDVLSDDFLDVVTGLIKKYDLPIDFLRLEITESAFAESTGEITATIKELIARGFTVEIDDFGSGYSSLNALKDVPSQILKLDLKFLENSGDSQRGGNILESVVRMAKWLDMSVIAEGVEAKEQADYLKSIGCNYVQGYFYSKPIPLAEYETLMEASKKEAKMSGLETVKNLDNNAFWDPKSMETLVFNSYVGGACIIEYHNGKSEIIRMNERFKQEFGNAKICGVPVAELGKSKSLNAENQRILKESYDQAVATGEETICEVCSLPVDGNDNCGLYLHITVRPIARSGDRWLLYCAIQNITKQRIIEQREKNTASQLSAIMSHVDSGITASVLHNDNTTEILFANDAFYAMFGYTRAQFQNEVKTAFDLCPPEEKEKIIQTARNVFNTRESATCECRCFKRDGSTVWIRVSDTVVSLPEFGETVILAVYTDITDAHETNERLCFLNSMADRLLAYPDVTQGIQAELSHLLKFLQGKRILIFEPSADGKTADNTYEICADDIASKKDALQNLPLTDSSPWQHTFETGNLVYVEDVDSLHCLAKERELLKSLNVRSLIAVRLMHNGDFIGVLCVQDPGISPSEIHQLSALGAYITIMLTHRNLTGRVNHKAQILLDNLPCGVGLYEYDGEKLRLLYLNSRYWSFVGRKPEEYLHRPPLEVVHPDDRALIWQEISAAVRQNRGFAAKNVRILRAENKYTPFRILGTVQKQDSGKYMLYTSFTPITELSMSFQETLPVALSVMMNTSTDFTVIKDANLRYICASQSAVSDMGLASVSELIGKTDQDVFPEYFAKEYTANDRSVMESGKPIIDADENLPPKAGRSRLGQSSRYPLRDTNGNIIGIYCVVRDITQIREQESQLKLLTNSIPGGIATFALMKNGEVRCLYCNHGFYHIAGYEKGEYETLTAASPLSLVIREDRQDIISAVEALKKHPEKTGICTYRSRAKDGSYRWFRMQGTVSEIREDAFIVNLVKYDISDQKISEEKLRQSEAEYRLAAKFSGTVICRYHVADQSITINRDIAQLYSLPPHIEGVPYSPAEQEQISPETTEAYTEFFESILRGEKEGTAVFQRFISGNWHWLNCHFETVFDDRSLPVSAIISFIDITEQQKTKVLAETDPLTGILNRTTFAQKLDALLSHNPNHICYALLMLDLDGFKRVNDTYGHPTGDKTLVNFVECLRAVVRAEDIVCRLGGDEFFVCLCGVAGREEIEKIAGRICALISTSFPPEMEVSTSIGIAVGPENGTDFNSLYIKADSALYHVKAQGKNGYTFYNDLSTDNEEHRKSIETTGNISE